MVYNKYTKGHKIGVLLFYLIFFMHISNAQSYSKLYNDELILEPILFDKKLYKYKCVSENIYLWDEEIEIDSLIRFSKDRDFIFTQSDISYFKEQRKSFNSIKWLHSNMGKLISLDLENKMLSKIDMSNCLLKKPIVKYSLPIFSKNKMCAFFRKIVIYGFMQDEDCIYFYRKEKGIWIFVNKYNCYMS